MSLILSCGWVGSIAMDGYRSREGFIPFFHTVNKTRELDMRSYSVLAAALGLVLYSTAGHAQATRTWVSGVGDDVNPCSRTAPCKTFSGAISKTAAGGEISVLDPGGFGTITITKSITLNGDGTLAGILSAGTVGVTVSSTIPATGVVILRNLSINGAGTGTNGVRVLGGATTIIDKCS